MFACGNQNFKKAFHLYVCDQIKYSLSAKQHFVILVLLGVSFAFFLIKILVECKIYVWIKYYYHKNNWVYIKQKIELYCTVGEKTVFH